MEIVTEMLHPVAAYRVYEFATPDEQYLLIELSLRDAMLRMEDIHTGSTYHGSVGLTVKMALAAGMLFEVYPFLSNRG